MSLRSHMKFWVMAMLLCVCSGVWGEVMTVKFDVVDMKTKDAVNDFEVQYMKSTDKSRTWRRVYRNKVRWLEDEGHFEVDYDYNKKRKEKVIMRVVADGFQVGKRQTIMAGVALKRVRTFRLRSLGNELMREYDGKKPALLGQVVDNVTGEHIKQFTVRVALLRDFNKNAKELSYVGRSELSYKYDVETGEFFAVASKATDENYVRFQVSAKGYKPREYRVSKRGGGFSRFTFRLDKQDDEFLSDVDVVDGYMRAHITDAESGEPINDAKIFRLFNYASSIIERDIKRGYIDCNQWPSMLKKGGDGEYLHLGINNDQTFIVVVEGYEPFTILLSNISDEKYIKYNYDKIVKFAGYGVTLDVKMKKVGKYEGFVVDEHDVVAAGAKVYVLDNSKDIEITYEKEAYTISDYIEMVETDSNGRFVVNKRKGNESFYIVHDKGVAFVNLKRQKAKEACKLLPWMGGKIDVVGYDIKGKSGYIQREDVFQVKDLLNDKETDITFKEKIAIREDGALERLPMRSMFFGNWFNLTMNVDDVTGQKSKQYVGRYKMSENARNIAQADPWGTHITYGQINGVADMEEGRAWTKVECQVIKQSLAEKVIESYLSPKDLASLRELHDQGEFEELLLEHSKLIWGERFDPKVTRLLNAEQKYDEDILQYVVKPDGGFELYRLSPGKYRLLINLENEAGEDWYVDEMIEVPEGAKYSNRFDAGEFEIKRREEESGVIEDAA
ncbi:hypothetical protein JD969_10310 [Planctomycetota bacterium]|nr:hypothetical protein JD969_10310 [Planctomycetota bacterium]